MKFLFEFSPVEQTYMCIVYPDHEPDTDRIPEALSGPLLIPIPYMGSCYLDFYSLLNVEARFHCVAQVGFELGVD